MKIISVSTQVSFDFDGTENFTFECVFTKQTDVMMTQACLSVTYYL